MSTAPEFPPGWEEFDPDKHELSDDPDYREARQQAQQRRETRTQAYGNLLRQLRTGRRVTQVALGEALNMVQSDISRIERQRDLRVSTLAAYLWALGADDVSLQVRFPEEEPVTVPLDTLAS